MSDLLRKETRVQKERIYALQAEVCRQQDAIVDLERQVLSQAQPSEWAWDRSKFTEDENELLMRVVGRLIDKMLCEGRREYGPLNMDEDDRTLEEVQDSALDEMIDALFYMTLRDMMTDRKGN